MAEMIRGKPVHEPMPKPAHDPRTHKPPRAVLTVEPTRVVRTWVMDSLDVIPVRASYKGRVDADAEACRLQYITDGAGMAMTYQEKFAQAQGVAALGEAAANALTVEDRNAQFPTLSASVGLEAATLWDCAQLVLLKYAAFAQVSRIIEAARLSGKKAIGDASDVAAVKAAYEAITWPTP